jgi:hypothetical protein
LSVIELPELYVTLGLTHEQPLYWIVPNLRGAIETKEPGPRPRAELEAAAAEYRHALALDPANVDAHLRLAWARILDTDARAEEDLMSLSTVTLGRATQYLVLMMEGLLAERHNDVTRAVAEYEAAQALVPAAQSACIALSQVLVLNNDDAAARSSADRCLSLPEGNDASDQWWSFRVGRPQPEARQALEEAHVP